MSIGKYGPWALITGGSEGIGAAFARKLAAQGFNIALTARKAEPLELVANELRDMGVEARWISADLSKPDVLDQVRTITDDIEIGFLLCTAGANETRGNIVDLDPAVYRSVIGINVMSQIEFAHHYGALMKARGRGGIILAGSSSNFCGAATLGPYTAAKAFSRILTESLWIECKPMGIDVLHMVVNFTATPAMQRLGLDVSTAQSPEEVAQEALDNMENGPLLILGGQRAFDMAVKRSSLVDRGDMITRFATPTRTNIPHVEKAST